MRVAGIRSIGGAVETIDVPDPTPLAADEVLIAVTAAGVGNWDDIVRQGGWDVGAVPPMALGVEAAGVVADVGRTAGDLAAGDEVMTHPLPLRGQGTWAPLLIAPAALVARKPAQMSWAVAGAFPVPALTAVQVVDEALAVRAGETVLVNGAGGVTGSLLVSLAAIRGARVIATAGPASGARLSRLGADEVLDYHDARWIDRATSAGVDAAVNAVPGERRRRCERFATAGVWRRSPRMRRTSGARFRSRPCTSTPTAHS
jgi:NADPH:quinone reductase-like Zn-dependent oxidoreductase